MIAGTDAAQRREGARMAKVVVVGGGVVGLAGATLLARDGHDVTVVERDPADPCAAADAWSSWERRGVNQFRQAHFLLSRFREVVDRELPDVAAALEDVGALRYNTLARIPEQISGGMRPEDDRFELVTARRPVLECVFAHRATATDGCTVRRGAAVRALHTDDGRVDGVVLDDGETIAADVVVDAGGRRSPMRDLIEAAGFRRPVEDRHDIGFVYYTRHFRSGDGSVPPAFGPLLQHYDSLSIGTLPADNGTWAIIVVASGNDREARALLDPDVWTKVVRSCPLVAHWVDGEPLSDDIAFMGGIEDRYRHFCPDGEPAAPGVLPLGDAFACTNPSVGRGISVGAMHAVALRDLLHGADLGDLHGLSLEWGRITDEGVGRYVDDTLRFDRHRLAEAEAQIAGRPYETDDEFWRQHRTLFGHSAADPELLRGVMDVMGALAPEREVLGRPEVARRIAARADVPYDAPPGPTRAEIVSVLGGSR
jgi:2-polyprenyl-6-methoxyphenol hydroxylase-like FAD-dependent oxidoreductase